MSELRLEHLELPLDLGDVRTGSAGGLDMLTRGDGVPAAQIARPARESDPQCGACAVEEQEQGAHWAPPACVNNFCAFFSAMRIAR